MCRIREIDFEKLDKLPFRSNKSSFYKHGLYRRHRHFYHPENNPYKLAERILANNIDKSFALAFSYYCKKVSKQHQAIFLEYFDKDRFYCYSTTYFIDDNGLIKRIIKNKFKKAIIFYSDDYLTELVHRITGHKKSDFGEIYVDKSLYSRYRKNFYNYRVFSHYEYGGHRYYMKPIWERYKAQKEDFIPKIVSGWSMEFTSNNDYKYKRLVAEKQKKLKLDRTIKYHRPIMSEVEFRRILNERRLKEKQENLTKIISHGFDPITSFRK